MCMHPGKSTQSSLHRRRPLPSPNTPTPSAFFEPFSTKQDMCDIEANTDLPACTPPCEVLEDIESDARCQDDGEGD
jgi:hypothetical protein